MRRARKAVQVPSELTDRLRDIESEIDLERPRHSARPLPQVVDILVRVGVDRKVAESNPLKQSINPMDMNGLTGLLELEGFKLSRFLPGHKIDYTNLYPGNNVYFNGCIFELQSGREVWYGDLDVTESRTKLSELADIFRAPFVATIEIPYRFQERLQFHPGGGAEVVSGLLSFIVEGSDKHGPQVTFFLPRGASEAEMKVFLNDVAKRFG
jgi:hypothetical protein